MGGTFDPIHIGHLVAAEEARTQFNLDKVIFMPAGAPAFKEKTQVTDAHHRYMMTQLATISNPHFEVSDMEIKREGTTYTVDTMKQMKSLYPHAEFFFITGADAVFEIVGWKNSAELANLVTFIATTRPGYDLNQAKMRHQDSIIDFKINWIEVPALSVSSTDLRSRLKEGRSVRYLIPRPVIGYIKKMGLYDTLNQGL